MSRVFILEPPKNNIDISRASEFGEIEFIFATGERRPSVFDTDVYSKQVLKILDEKNFEPGCDCFCVVGSFIKLITAVAAMIHKFKSINVLFYNALENEYVLRPIGSFLDEAISQDV